MALKGLNQAICNERDAGEATGRSDRGSAESHRNNRSMLAVGIAAEGHLRLILPPGEVVSGPMAEAVADEVKRLAGKRKLPMLLILTGVEAISTAARRVFSTAESLAAVAVVGVSPVDRVIANFLLGGAVQPCPTRYFSTEKDALRWLKRRPNDA